MDIGARLGADRSTQHDLNRQATELADFVPGLNLAVGLNDASRKIKAGNDAGGMAEIGLAALGLLPSLGGMVRKAGEKLTRGKFEMDYFGQSVGILQNPTPEQIVGFLNRTKYQSARRIHIPETGETFIWDAADPALHKLVAEKLGISIDDKLIMDIIGLD